MQAICLRLSFSIEKGKQIACISSRLLSPLGDVMLNSNG